MRKRITISRRSAEDEGPGRTRPGRHSLAVRSHAALGYTAVEIVFVAGLTVTLGGMAVPSLVSGLDDYRTAGAARHVSTRMQRARMEAVSRSAEVAMQFIQ